jgi:hypothetical protein
MPDLVLIEQPTIAYVRYFDGHETADSTTLEIETLTEKGESWDRAASVTVQRLGRSGIYLSDPIELHPGWTELTAAAARAMGAARPKVRVPGCNGVVLAKKGDPVAERPVEQSCTADVLFGLTARLGVYRSVAFGHDEPLHYAFVGEGCRNAPLLPPDEVE